MTCAADRISLLKGEYVKMIFSVVEPSPTVPGQFDPRDLTGLGIEFQVKVKAGDPDPALIAKSVGSGITLLPQSGDTVGKFELVIQTGDTSSRATGSYTYDLWLIDGAERRPLRLPSPFEIKPAVNLP